MADIFVDASATGTGDGLSPANAVISITSIAWNPGDKAWVRKSHNETLTLSMNVGPNFNTQLFERVGYLIGWPDRADYPFYSERPAAGISASWDTDVSSNAFLTVTSENVPTFTYSSGSTITGLLMGNNVVGANLGFLNSAANNVPTFAGPATFFSKGQRYYNNIFMGGVNGYCRTMPALTFNAGKITVVASSGIGEGFFQGTIGGNVEHLVIGSMSNSNSLALVQGQTNGTNNFHIGLLEVNKQLFFGEQSSGLINEVGVATYPVYIERAIGVKPTVGKVDLYMSIWCNDWFGEGPVQALNVGHGTRVASSGEAQYNGLSAVCYNVSSKSGASMILMQDVRDSHPLISHLFSVTSGTGVEIRVPIYVGSTSTYSLHNSWASLLAKGTGIVHAGSANVHAGSFTPWTGSLVLAGSAWEASFVFTPTETANVQFNFFMGRHTRVTSGAVIAQQYTLFGQPYKV